MDVCFSGWRGEKLLIYPTDVSVMFKLRNNSVRRQHEATEMWHVHSLIGLTHTMLISRNFRGMRKWEISLHWIVLQTILIKLKGFYCKATSHDTRVLRGRRLCTSQTIINWYFSQKETNFSSQNGNNDNKRHNLW